jgi:GT2 family glycosyltransferase
MRCSFIIPFHSGLPFLTQCLDALTARSADSEVLIAADAPLDDCRALADAHQARVVAIAGPSGPAAARNAAAAAALGDVLVFIDADVAVSAAGLTRMACVFDEQPHVAAVFGAYDDEPADRGFMSQYKNLSHSLIHHTSAAKARTFWAGFGAVRRDAFHRVGGFDERFERPSVEDIDLGYRLTAAGYEVLLDPGLSASHLKRWTMASAIVSDVRDRGIPWTQLIWRYGTFDNDLNLRTEYRLSIALAYLALASLLATFYDSRALLALAGTLIGAVLVNRRYLRFFYVKRGAWFAVRVGALRIIQDLGNGLSFAVGTALFFAARAGGVRLPGGLATKPWGPPAARSAGL